MLISYNDNAKKFEIECSFSENSLIADLPNKRFQNRRRTWYAPTLSRNAAYLLEKFRDKMTPEAIVVAEKSISRVQISTEPCPAQHKYKTAPLAHQVRGVNGVWGLNKHALFMEMGTGKTKIAIDTYSARIAEGQIDVWVVVCPFSVRGNWEEEIEKHYPDPGLPVFVVGELTTKKKAEQMVKEADRVEQFICIIGIESLQQQKCGGRAYDTLINMIGGKKFGITLDESHFAKNPDANRSKTVEYIASLTQYCSIMTGTEITDCLMDLYQQFQILDPNIIGMGDYYSFRNRYAVMGGYENKDIVGYQNVDELMDMIRPYVFQCSKTDAALDLPDKLYTRRTVKMAKEQERVYKELDNSLESMIRDMQRQGRSIEVILENALTKYNALQQITGGFIRYDEVNEEAETKTRRTTWLVEPAHNPKIRELINVIEENHNQSIIVWAKSRDEITAICNVLTTKYGSSSFVEYHGGVSNEDRKANIAAFKSRAARFFVSNQQTGGTGLTLNEASLVVYFSNSLKLVDRMQSEDRAHRIGQKNNVIYVDIVCQGTKDEEVLAAIRNKKEIADFVRDKIGGVL